MVLAEVGLSDLIWTSVWVFFLIMFAWVFIAVVSDLFRDHTTSGGAKAAWVVALIVFPVVGSLAYLVLRGHGMAERSAAREQAARGRVDDYIRSTVAAGGSGPVEDLARLASLRDAGAVTDDEYEAIKARVVQGPVATA